MFVICIINGRQSRQSSFVIKCSDLRSILGMFPDLASGCNQHVVRVESYFSNAVLSDDLFIICDETCDSRCCHRLELAMAKTIKGLT